MVLLMMRLVVLIKALVVPRKLMVDSKNPLVVLRQRVVVKTVRGVKKPGVEVKKPWVVFLVSGPSVERVVFPHTESLYKIDIYKLCKKVQCFIITIYNRE